MSLTTESQRKIEKALRQEVESLQNLVGSLTEQLQEQQGIIDQLSQQLKQKQERIAQLEAELREQKKLKGRPKITASQLNEKTPKPQGEGKRPGSAKKSKKIGFQIHEEKIIQPAEIPPQAKFNGYRNYDVQELKIKRHNIRISTGQINQILTENQEEFHTEQAQVLARGLETASYVHTDDTGARHQGKNGYCTVIGNQWFAYFRSSQSKSRQNFLETLQGDNPIYVLNEEARSYLELSDLAAKHWQKLEFSSEVLATQASQWSSYLESLGILTTKTRRLVSEAALLGGVMAQGVSGQLRILSDGAGQFNRK